MAIKKNTGRQEPAVASVSFTIGTGKDVPTNGTYPAIQIPQGAIVQKVAVNVITASSAGTTISVGDAGLATRYQTTTSGAAVAMTTSNGTGYKYPSTQDIILTVAGTPTTAGLVEVYVEYIQTGKAEWNEG